MNDQFITLDDQLRLFYRITGGGDTTIIFTPGWMMSSSVFERQLAHFEDSSRFQALSYDPRGQGRSSKPVEGHSYQQHARDLARLIMRLDLKSVVLAGWSFGVIEQLAYLDQFGVDRVEALVMIDCGPRVSGRSRDEWIWYLADDADGYARGFTEGVIENRDQVVSAFCQWMLEDASDDNLAWVTAIAQHTSSSVASITNATGFYLDYSDLLVSLEGRLPMLYVVREEVQAVADSWIKDNTPSATSLFLGKHLMFWERHEIFNRALDDFLSGLNSN